MTKQALYYTWVEFLVVRLVLAGEIDEALSVAEEVAQSFEKKRSDTMKALLKGNRDLSSLQAIAMVEQEKHRRLR